MFLSDANKQTNGLTNMIEINASKFNLDKAKQVTLHSASYYVFSDDNNQKYIIMHGNANGSYDARCESALQTFKSAIVICCYPETMRNAGINAIGEWNTETTFAYAGDTLYVMAK